VAQRVPCTVARLPFRGERSSLGTRASDVLGWERAGGGRREKTFPSRLSIRDENYVPAIVSIAADRNSRDTADTRLPEPDEIRPMAARSRSASSRRFGEAAEYRSRERERERERERRESAARTRSSLARRRAGRSRGGSRGRGGEGLGEETFPRAREERERTEEQRPMEVGKPRSPRQAARQGRKEKGETRIDPISYSRS